MSIDALTLNPPLVTVTESSAAPAQAARRCSVVVRLGSEASQGSLEAFEELIGLFEPRIYNFLARHLGNAHDAEDLTQETFVRAWRAIRRFDPERDFATWIFVIARRAAANHFRSHRNHDELPDDIAHQGDDPRAAAASEDVSQNLWRAAKKLKPNQYEALWLRYAEGFSVKETARVMGLTTIHVKVILHRGRKELARHLKPDHL